MAAADDTVLVLSLSAAVHADEVPPHMASAPTYRIAPVGDTTPRYDVIGTPKALKSAEQAFRDVLADIEQNRKATRRLHILGAAPASACVALGRTLTRGVHPALTLYDRHEDNYLRAMEIN